MVYAMGGTPNRDEIFQLLADTADGVALRVKVVPGASRAAIRGILADRLKVTIAAPAEAGKANKAVCALLAKTFGTARREVKVVAGERQQLKTIELCGVDRKTAVECLECLLTE